ncbi:hypothetical protein CEJ86_30795 [Sinorhizobium meliloti]|uniref:Uncharacterized protein n=1 Tax=Rhizobium meliloti TaxID=382 RepID=A0A2J0YTS9_RHIML|nr:hypothetical protein CEJ86_30795 [Sinorhizobium meliloti]
MSVTIPSVAMLPFKNLSADNTLGYLGEGVANDVIAILSRFSDNYGRIKERVTVKVTPGPPTLSQC